MTPEEIDAWLVRTLEDRLLSRGERQALGAFIAALKPGADRNFIRHQAFERARDALGQAGDRPVLDWLEDVLKVVGKDAPTAPPPRAETYFSPGADCTRAIEGLLGHARRSAEVCVFTITDDRLSDALHDAHWRGVAVRIITDNDKAVDLGSDVDRLARAGIPVRVDRTPYHMHHKFAIIDGRTLLTGSYNWTRGAARDNEENLIVVDDRRLVSPFAETFEQLWARLA